MRRMGFLSFLAAVFSLAAALSWANPAFAGEAGASPSPSSSSSSDRGAIVGELIGRMVDDGFLSAEKGAEAAAKYGGREAEKEGMLARVFSWAGLLKLAAVALLLVALQGVLRKLVLGLWFLIVGVPLWVWQGSALSLTAAMALRGGWFWESQASWVGVFGAMAVPMVVGWMVATQEVLRELLARIFKLGIPAGVVASAWCLVWFGALALDSGSKTLGFMAVVSFSGMFCFGFSYGFGCLSLGIREDDWLGAALIGNLAALAAWGAGASFGMIQAGFVEVFRTGAEWYLPIAVGTALFVGAWPWARDAKRFAYLMATIVLFGVSTWFFFDPNLAKPAGLLMFFGVLVGLEWLAWAGFSGGLIAGCAVSGGVLYGMAVLFERHGEAIVRVMTGA